MIRTLSSRLILLAALAAAAPAFGQTAQPFDMSGERGTSAAPDAPAQPMPPAQGYVPPLQIGPSGEVTQPLPGAPQQAAPGFTVPSMVPSMTAPAGAPTPGVPSIAITAPVAPVPAAAVQAAAKPGEKRLIRYIVPQPSLRLEGENDQRSWSVFLTAAEAGRAAEIQLAYKNAIVVMPEASRLRVLLNNEVVLEAPLASSEKFKPVTAAVPAGLLRPGPNVLRIQAFQRHRTDCSTDSTYELWTDIDPSASFLAMEPSGPPDTLQSLEDLPAVGYGPDGTSGIHFIVPGASQGIAADNIMKLAQAIGVLGGYPNPTVRISDAPGEPDPRGTLTVMLGTAPDINAMLAAPIAAAATQPVVSFLSEPQLGAAVLAVTGANWGQVTAAVEAIAARADRPLGQPRLALSTASWLSPDVRLFRGAETVSLDKLGVTTQQFSGRRFRAQFAVGIPSDFYAESYGEATLLLDAAYTSAVLPASQFDVYVNGQIAATTRIVNRTGGIFRQLPIQIPFRHFRPGVNNIMLEAVLNTDADRACVPGGSIAGSDRFVLFDTTEFSMPAFARIARRPNLAAFSGTAFPYGVATTPSALVLGRTDIDTLSAAGTLVARLAIQAGRIVPLALTAAANVGDQSAIFVGVASQFSEGMLGRLGIAETVRVDWKPDSSRPPEQPAGPSAVALPGADITDSGGQSGGATENTDAVFDRWRTALAGGGGWRGQVSSFEDWMKRNFDISFSALRIGPAAEVAFQPKARASLVLAQAISPGGNGTWTMMTAPSAANLTSGANSIAAIAAWSRLAGQFSAFTEATGTLENRPAANYQFVVTQPLSLQNARLIAANWFSSNIAVYAFCLIGLCIALGIVTSGLLFRLGRPS